MSKPHKTNFMALIAGEVAPAAMDPGPVIPLKPPAAPNKPAGIKQRCHQLSHYLEDPVFDQMRSIAFEERVKMHQLLLEAVDLLLKKRGAPSIRELTRKTG